MTIDSDCIFIDTAPLIYYLEGNAKYFRYVESFFQQCFEFDKRLKTSVISKLEFCVKPYQEDQYELIKLFHAFVRDAHMEMVSINETDAEFAAQLRAQNNFLKNFDALQIAVAINNGCDTFLTNDKKLQRIQDINVVVLATQKVKFHQG